MKPLAAALCILASATWAQKVKFIPTQPSAGQVQTPFLIERTATGQCISLGLTDPVFTVCNTLDTAMLFALQPATAANGVDVCLFQSPTICLKQRLRPDGNIGNGDTCLAGVAGSSRVVLQACNDSGVFDFHLLTSFMPAACGRPAPIPTDAPNKMLPTIYTQGFLGGNAHLVFSFDPQTAIYGQMISFAPEPMSKTTVQRLLPVPTACVPTIVGWGSTYQSSSVTSILTSTVTTISGTRQTLTYNQPVLTAVGNPVSGCFFSATIAQTASCFSTTLTTSTNVAGATETFVHAYGAADIQAKALGSPSQSGQLYPFTLLYPYKASSITIPTDPFSATFSILSQNIQMTDSSSGTLFFIVTGGLSNRAYMVSDMTATDNLNGGVFTGTQDPTTPSNFEFSTPLTCGNSFSVTITAQICESNGNTPIPTCLQQRTSIPFTSHTFQVSINTRQPSSSSERNCAVTLSIESSFDVTATLIDIADTLTSNNTSLSNTDLWQINLQSAHLRKSAIYLDVVSVLIHTIGKPLVKVRLSADCFSKVATGFGTNVFTFPAVLLDPSVSSYSSPPNETAAWHGAYDPNFPATQQSCTEGGFLLDKNERYQFLFTLQFNSTVPPGAPVRRRQNSDDMTSQAALPQMQSAGAGLLFEYNPQQGKGANGNSNGSVAAQGLWTPAVIAGVVAGGVALVAFIAAALIIYRHRRQKEEQTAASSEARTNSTTSLFADPLLAAK